MLPSETKTYKRLSELPLPDQAIVTSKIKIALIVPPSPYVTPNGWEWCNRAPFEGPSIIASELKGLGYSLKLFDQRATPAAIALQGKLNNYDIISICTYEDCFPYIKALCEIIKKDNPQSIIVLGGPLVTSAPELVMKNTMADYGIIGEGELTLMEFMDFFTENVHAISKDKIDGLAWKDENGKVVLNHAREQMDQLDAVPFQDFSVWERYKGKDIPEVFLSFSRGCVCNCAFCYRPMPKLRRKSIDRVKRELAYLGKRNFKMAWWNDLTFVTDREFVHKLLDEAFPAHPHRWCCFARGVGMDLPILKHMKQMGCDLILYGFESITQNVLDCYHKGTTQSTIVNTIKATRESGIKCGGLIIVGAPNETKESIDNLIKFCREFKEITRVKYLSLIPGTELYRQALKDGIIKDELQHLYWLAQEEAIEEDIDKPGFIQMSKYLTREELKQAYHEVNQVIEERPYDYSNEENVYLEKPEEFKKGKNLLAAREIS